MLPVSFTSEILVRALLTVLYTALGCGAVVVLLYVCLRPGPELFRKLLHFSVLAVLTAWLYAFEDWRLGAICMAVLAVVLILLLLGLERLPFLPELSWRRRKGELKHSVCALGLMYLVVTALCCGLLGSRRLALAAIFAWGPGDAAAALIGKRFGKTKIGREKKKSLEGTLAMFSCAFVSVFVLLVWHGAFGVGKAAGMALLTAAVTAVVELQVLSGFDTFFCPAAAAVVLCALNAVL